MTIKDVLEINIHELQKLRVQLGEPELYQAILKTINDLRICVDALTMGEEAERVAAEQALAEGAEAHE